jgi:hypothetical protein
MQNDSSDIHAEIADGQLVLRMSLEAGRRFATLLRAQHEFMQFVDVQRRLHTAFATTEDAAATARDPEITFYAGLSAGFLDSLAGVNTLETSTADFEAHANAAWDRYIAAHPLPNQTTTVWLGADNRQFGARGPYPRRVPAWEDVARMLLQGLVSTRQRNLPEPTLKGMCDELIRLKVRGAPRHKNTLSLWVSKSREKAGLCGGYRDAIREFRTEVNHRVELLREQMAAG